MEARFAGIGSEDLAGRFQDEERHVDFPGADVRLRFS